MKKYTIISLFAIIIGITYFVVRAQAMPQGAKHELMNVHYDNYYQDELNISTADGKFEKINLAKGKKKEDISQVLMKMKEFEEQGWIFKSLSVAPYGSVGAYTIYNYSFER